MFIFQGGHGYFLSYCVKRLMPCFYNSNDCWPHSSCNYGEVGFDGFFVIKVMTSGKKLCVSGGFGVRCFCRVNSPVCEPPSPFSLSGLLTHHFLKSS